MSKEGEALEPENGVADEFNEFLNGPSPETEKIPEDKDVEAEGDEPEEEVTEVEVTDEQKAEMEDFQSLIDKGYDSLSDEEKEKYDDYKSRYETKDDEPEKQEEEKEEPESWKEYKEEDLIKKIDDGEDISDDQIEFLRSKGHEIDVEEAEPDKAEDKTKEEEKAKEDTEGKLPSYIDDLKSISAFSEREFKTVEEAEQGVKEYVQMQEAKDKKLMDILSNNPEITGIIGDLAKGKDATQAVKDHFEDLFNDEAPKPGDDGYDTYVIEKAERRKAKALENERQQKRAENMEKSIKSAAKFVQSKELPQDKAEEYFGTLDKYMNDLTSGVVNEEFLDLVYKGLNYDKLKDENKKAVEDAEKRGETRAMNRKITLTKRQPKGDGLAKVKRNVSRKIGNQVQYASQTAKDFEDFLGG